MTPLKVRLALPLVAAGGAIGALVRWSITEAWPTPDAGSFPWSIFTVNVAGSAVLALLPALVSGSRWLPLFLGTGMLGGFTTMSTASEQTVQLLTGGHRLIGLSYAGGTLVCAVLAVWAAEQRSLLAAEEGDE